MIFNIYILNNNKYLLSLSHNFKLKYYDKRKNLVFIGLQIVSWVIFVGLCIEAGALILNFVFSLFKPESVENLYQKLDLSQMYNY